MNILKCLLIVLALLCPNLLVAQDSLVHPKQKIKIVLLGTYHFANPGADKFNVRVDDYSTPKRQQQIQELNNALARFAPKKIFTESNSSFQAQADSLFQLYKAGKWDIPAKVVSERFQIGLKLAKQLNNDHIYCADAEGKWLAPEVEKYADSMQIEYVKQMEKYFEQYTQWFNNYISNHTVKQNLAYLNRPEELLNHNHYIYNYVFARVGAGKNYIGAELVGEWYKRNVKIYANILQNITPADKRVLVIFGAGHMHILKQLFKDNPDFEVVEVNKYLDK
ncbi:DUF5694 domain-containing protein [Mucilaginibacter terrae]|uniref:TraB/GumN family protein n=1 Tax=Mucilaginibacter terrae TaxID=1955052 RepID=A0ABU3GU74_9SPHI|nr:DUF5694 domain-containing protein [Mucilaginibacter terrae]MDT3403333.1 hypothetical protein [Mucilaginibacter terrae]